jgi:GT2 family glycosyltransferase
VIFVDNDSQDDTPHVLAALAKRYPTHLRTAHEGRPGLSYGRNLGIELARAPVVAFTDDDVRVSQDWITVLHEAMTQHPEIDGVGGRVLPQWSVPPPSWLTPRHWSPLALVDYGSSAFYVDHSRQVCLIGANVAYRRAALDRIGRFCGTFTRCQDHELLLRFWHAGMRALYLPQLIVTCEVPATRLKWSYHRDWHTQHGHFCAQMPDELGPEGSPPDALTLFGTPAALYRQLITSVGRLAVATALGRRDDALDASATMHHRFSFVRTRARLWRREKRSLIRELARFAVAFASRRRVNRVRHSLPE